MDRAISRSVTVRAGAPACVAIRRGAAALGPFAYDRGSWTARPRDALHAQHETGLVPAPREAAAAGYDDVISYLAETTDRTPGSTKRVRRWGEGRRPAQDPSPGAVRRARQQAGPAGLLTDQAEHDDLHSIWLVRFVADDGHRTVEVPVGFLDGSVIGARSGDLPLP